MNGLSTRNAALLCLVPPTLSAAIALLVFQPAFQTNDDVCMSMCAQGAGFAAERTPFLLWSNVLYGQFLNALYVAAPSVAWYRVVGIVVQVLANAVICFVLFRRGLPRAGLLLLAAYFVCFDLYFHVHPQFTVIAALPAIAAVVLWLDGLRQRRIGMKGWLLAAPAALSVIALLALSSLIRFPSVELVLLLSAPVLLFQWLRPEGEAPAGAGLFGWRRLRWGWAMVMPIATAVVLAGHWYDDYAYKATPGWETFHERNLMALWLCTAGDVPGPPRALHAQLARPFSAECYSELGRNRARKRHNEMRTSSHGTLCRAGRAQARLT